VWKFYRRKATVIYPPIEINLKSQISNLKQILNSKIQNKNYYLSVGRLSWAKRVDLIINACNQLKLSLVVAGTGKEEKELKQIAARPPLAGAGGAAGWSPTVEFLGSVSDEELTLLYTNAKALIFSALDEDFGMVPVEAMAAGTPVIALAQGGVKETVIDGKTGVLVDEPTVESLINAIRRFERLSKGKDWIKECKKQAEKFSKEEFQRKLKKFVEEKAKLLS
jgi:glycosyltransferase involved in cell wall biosynthesis